MIKIYEKLFIRFPHDFDDDPIYGQKYLVNAESAVMNVLMFFRPEIPLSRKKVQSLLPLLKLSFISSIILPTHRP